MLLRKALWKTGSLSPNTRTLLSGLPPHCRIKPTAGPTPAADEPASDTPTVSITAFLAARTVSPGSLA